MLVLVKTKWQYYFLHKRISDKNQGERESVKVAQVDFDLCSRVGVLYRFELRTCLEVVSGESCRNGGVRICFGV